MEEKKFDPTKPVQTRDGRPARIVDMDLKKSNGKSLAVVVGLSSGNETIGARFSDGRVFSNGQADDGDLVNVPVIHGMANLKEFQGAAEPVFINLSRAYTQARSASTDQSYHGGEWPIARLVVTPDGKITSARLVTTDDLDG